MKEMKKYLDLIPISARQRKRQSRMTRLCIILAVFLVASIFSMADMEIQAQIYRTIQDYGSWHAVFGGLTRNRSAWSGKGQRWNHQPGMQRRTTGWIRDTR